MINKILSSYSKYKNGEVKYLQIGSFDGITGDLIYPFIRKHNWNGYRIEPFPQHYKKLQELHNNEHNTKCINIAIGSKDEIKTFYYVIEANDNPSFAAQLGSFEKNVILKHKDKIPNLESKINSVDIQSISPNTLIKKYNIQKIDILYIDTEGYDAIILKSFDLDVIVPDIIIFENKHIEQNPLDELYKMLYEKQYYIIEIGHDSLAMSFHLVLNLFVEIDNKKIQLERIHNGKYRFVTYLSFILKALKTRIIEK